MQVFLPYNNMYEIASCLIKDKRRYNKQIVECGQIIKAIKGESEAWKNHPIVHQYKPYLDFLIYYKNYLESYKLCINTPHYIRNAILFEKYLVDQSFKYTPFLFNQEYLDSHKRRLFQKNFEAFPEFEEYNSNDTSNLYCVPLNFILPKRKGVSEVKRFDKYKMIRYE